jgi:MYXO-CTERM domain-containing protein
MIRTASMNWGAWDGFDDALQAAVTLPDTIAFNDFKNCLACYISAQGVTFDQTMFLRQLYEKVIKPMADTQALFDSAAYVTRLYTTMSADEMTTDPAFDFNKDLADVSNLHTATIAVGCGNVGPWTATLAPGVTVSGPTVGMWPIKLGDQPAARKILEYGKQGEGKVVEDRSAMIEKLLKTSAATAPSGTGGSGGTGVSSGGGKAGTTGTSSGAAGSSKGSNQGVDAGTTGGGLPNSNDTKHSGGCAVATGSTSNAALWLLATGLVLAARRRRLTSRRAA